MEIGRDMGVELGNGPEDWCGVKFIVRIRGMGESVYVEVDPSSCGIVLSSRYPTHKRIKSSTTVNTTSNTQSTTILDQTSTTTKTPTTKSSTTQPSPPQPTKPHHPKSNPKMSSTTMQSVQFMYIPNLVGRQILRVPVLPCEEQTLLTTPGLSYSENTTPASSYTSYNGEFISRSRRASTPDSDVTVSSCEVSDEE